MYCEARDLAIKAGDVNLALDATGTMANLTSWIRLR